MGTSKGRRGSGASTSVVIAANSPHRLEQHEAAGGWPSRVKVLASSTLGTAASREGGRIIALTEEDFRKSGFKARETVAVLAGPHRLIAGRLSPLPSAALRPGGVGLASASARSLDCEEGARVRVRRLLDTSVTVLVASAVELVLDAGSPGGRSALQASPHAYLAGFTPGRRALLHRAAGFCAHGVHAREGDQLLVSFEGVPHSFRVARLRPPRCGYLDPAISKVETQGTPLVAAGRAALRREEGRDGDSLVAPLAVLSISESPVVAAAVVATATGSSLATASPALGNSEKNALPPLSPPRQTDGGNASTLENECSNETVKGPSSAAELSDREGAAPTAVPGAAAAAAAPGEAARFVGNVQKTNKAARARLETFYREHNPEKLDGIDGILTKYLGREGELFAKLEKKYGPSSSLRSATAGGDAGRDRRRGESGTLASAPASPFSRQPSTPADGKAGAPPRTPSAECHRVGGTPGGGSDKAGIRGWGCGETLWLINPDTAIDISGADAPPACNGVAPEENSQEGTAGTGGSAGFRRNREGAQGDGEDWGSVGGLSSQIQQLREAIELPLRSPEVLRRYGLRPPRGVLLHGPPGTGKTTLARAAAKACGCHVIVVNGSEVMSRFVGESEGALRQTFAEASENAPCLIVFDEVDTLCPRRDQAGSEAQRRVVSTMLALLDGIDAQKQVVVIACTNRPQALDPALRRPGRLDSEVEVGVPDAAGRAEILEVLLRGVPHAMGAAAAANASTGDGENNGKGLGGGAREIAARTHGFVGADLQLLVKEAALQALRRTRGGWGALSGGGGDGVGEEEEEDEEERGGNADGFATERIGRPSGVGRKGLPTLTPPDFLAALPLVSPSGLREVAVEVPSVKWGDIGGMEGVKQSLREVVEWPLRHPEAFQRMGMSPPRGVLLYGPPGCSKTLMARALATESGMNFLAVKGPELLSKWLGESERAMQALFKRARAAAPTIIFFDEVDALACKRGGGGEGGAGATERVLTQLLTELDGIQPVKRLVVVAATNRPDVIDPALLRPGRLDRLVYVPPPDTPSRREILRLSLAKVPCSGDVDREELARRTEGFSGAEVVALCREASICALEEDRSATQVRQAHLVEALGQMTPQITPSVLASYSCFQRGVV